MSLSKKITLERSYYYDCKKLNIHEIKIANKLFECQAFLDLRESTDFYDAVMNLGSGRNPSRSYELIVDLGSTPAVTFSGVESAITKVWPKNATRKDAISIFMHLTGLDGWYGL